MATAVDSVEPTSARYGQDILPLPRKDRYAGSLLMFWLWAGGNVLLTSFILGSYYASALGISGLIVATVVGSLLGCLLPALTGLRSARYGIDEYVGMRSTFGTYGAYIGVALLVIINFGWIGILSQIAGNSGISAILQLSKHANASTGFGANWFTLFALICGILIPVIMLYISPKTVFRLVKWTVPLLILFALILLSKLLSDFSWGHLTAIHATHSVTFAYAIEAAVAYNISWFPYMGSWNRFAKTQKAAFWGGWGGLTAISILFAVIGGMASLAFNSGDPSAWATKAGLGWAAIFIIVFSTIINCAMLFYASVMALKVAIPKINYHLVVLLVAIPSIPFLYQGTLSAKFNDILTVVGALEAPYWGIALGDYFLLRRERLSVPDLYRRNGPYWFTGGFNLGAIVIWLGGVVVWLWLAGATTLISWAQTFGSGGVSVYNVLTASTPVILGCAVVYYLVGHRLGWALRSRPKASVLGASARAAGAAGPAAPEAGAASGASG
jgi:nucleobase:cation symporter-1, NCS1 family